MSEDTTKLSPAGERALAMSRDLRAYPGDFFMRAAVQARPSPQDLVEMLDDAAGAQQGGVCLNRAHAERLLRQLGVQTWRVSPGLSRAGQYELVIPIATGQHTVSVRRFPQPHVFSLVVSH